MKAKKSTFALIVMSLGLIFCFMLSKPVNADTYNIGNYTVTENGNVVSVTDQETGLSAYLNRDTGLLTDIDGTVSYVKENNGVDYISAFSSSNLLATSGLRPGELCHNCHIQFRICSVSTIVYLRFNCFNSESS